ncbi:outer membrane beta-barrel protein [Massilia sp. CF038]|uniref:outer membrane beta-barrel protein n=1 Tax=Massilia sp. CF038 TaxID=1881045 RepID=UPI0009187C5B|nr:outer membrane beta-barrel protein [Massilia sp. CF038]SHH53783.1 OmpA-OmpF porin, OOP family [Massilia sp. CF038]
MNKLFASTLALAAIFSAPLAQADDSLYAGATIGQRSSVDLVLYGTRQSDTRQPRAFSLRGGYQVNDNVGIEAAYTSFGKHRFASGASVDMGALSLAVKGSIALNDKFSVFGKAGVARHTLKLTGTASDNGSDSKARALLGAGVAYRLSEQVDLTLEVVDYGTLRTGAGELKLRQFEAGINLRF